MKNKYNAHLDMFLAGQESRECCVSVSDVRRDSRYLLVSASWYCQYQTTRLTMIFLQNVCILKVEYCMQIIKLKYKRMNLFSYE